MENGDPENDATVQSYVSCFRKDNKRRNQIRGIGSVIFMLGVPMCIAGIVLTIVAYSDILGTNTVPFFNILGPTLLCSSVGFFLVGALCYEVANINLYSPRRYCDDDIVLTTRLTYPALQLSDEDDNDSTKAVIQGQNRLNEKRDKKRVKKLKFSKKMMEESFYSLDSILSAKSNKSENSSVTTNG